MCKTLGEGSEEGVVGDGHPAAVTAHFMDEGIVSARHLAVTVTVLFELLEVEGDSIGRAVDVVGAVFKSSLPVRVVSLHQHGLASIFPEAPGQ